MDVQKVLAQAEQLLKRGKTQEAVEKYEEVLQADPQNEVAANKAALAYVDLKQKPKAVGLYCNIAKRASAKGKNQKALALYKQALAIEESDPRALKGIAEESEQLGKFSDAVKFSELLVNVYLPRKRYLEIIDACARLVRCQPDNDRAKQIWIEVVRVLADEGKLARALVVFCGPPGLVSAEEQIGGDPSKIGQAVLSQLISLQEWFPVDPSLPYALAWVAYRNNNRKSAYRFLAESFRRDPDYCLSMLLFARLLIEEEKLPEAQFVFDYAKQNLPRDYRTNIKILTEQVAGFEKANGWMAFNEGFGAGGLSPDNFLRKIYGMELAAEGMDEPTKTSTAMPSETAEREIQLTPAPGASVAAAARDDDEFEVTAMVVSPSAVAPSSDGMELELSPSEARIGDTSKLIKATGEGLTPPPPPAMKSHPPTAPNPSVAAPVHVPDSEAPSQVTRMNDDLLNDIILGSSAPQPAPAEAADDSSTDANTSTEIYSPQDMVNASRWDKAAQFEIDAQTIHVARQDKEALIAQQEKNTRMLLKEEADKRQSEKKPGAVSSIMKLAGLRRPRLNEEDTGSFQVNPKDLADEDDAQTMVFQPGKASAAATTAGESKESEKDPTIQLKLDPSAMTNLSESGIQLGSGQNPTSELKLEEYGITHGADVSSQVGGTESEAKIDLNATSGDSPSPDELLLDADQRAAPKLRSPGAAQSFGMPEGDDEPTVHNLRGIGEIDPEENLAELSLESRTNIKAPQARRPAPAAKPSAPVAKPVAPTGKLELEPEGEKTIKLEAPKPRRADSIKPAAPANPPVGGAEKREFAPFAPSRVTVGYENKDPSEEPSQIKPFTIAAGEIEKRHEERVTEMLVVSNKAKPTPIVNAEESPPPPPKSAQAEGTMVIRLSEVDERKPGLVELPPGREASGKSAASGVDVGSDLIAEPGVRDEFPFEPTKQFRAELGPKSEDPAPMLAAAEDFLARGQYYLARKACREALAAGANEAIVKSKLAAIRERELPESFYRQYSTDEKAGKTTAKVDDIIRGLERDFDISFRDELPDFEMRKSAKQLRPVIEEQLSGCDSKLRIDLGVAFFEMGFFEEAENQFLNASTDEAARFEASYLAAQAMAARGNHRSAIDVLDTLLKDGGKAERDFLPVYYLLGESYAAIEDGAEARRYFRLVADIDRNYRSVRDKLDGEANG